MIKFKVLIISILVLSSCEYIGAGSLGAYKIKGFPFTNKALHLSTKTFYIEYPEYQMPEKWKYELEYWKKDGIDKKKILMFYFKTGPEEMYFVHILEPGMVKDPEYARIAVVSVYSQKSGWQEIKKFKKEEMERIEQRFESEIISKLEKLTNTETFDEKTYP